MLGLSFISKLEWDIYVVSIARTTSKKIEAVIRSMKFLSPEVAPNLYKCTIRPCMEYCCHVWAGALVTSWIWLINSRKGQAGRSFLYLLPLVNPWLIV